MTRNPAEKPALTRAVADLFGDLVADLFGDLSRATTCEAPPGGVLQLPPTKLWCLVEGEVLVHRGARPIEVWRAPRPLDLAGSVSDRRAIHAIAVTNVRYAGIDRDALPADALVQALACEQAQLWSRIEADARREDDLFLPWAEPIPGPWQFRDARAIVLVMQGDAARIRACVPPRLRLLPGTSDRYLLVLVRFADVGGVDDTEAERFSYHEVAPFIPVWSGLRAPAAFIPELYPDAPMAVLLGREIHGFPKRLARVTLHDDGGDLIVARKLALRVRWRGRDVLGPHEGLGALARAYSGLPLVDRITELLGRSRHELGLSVIVHKRIGAPETAGRTNEIDRLVRVPFKVEPLRRVERLTGLEVATSNDVGILHGRALAGFVVETGMQFGAGSSEGRAR